VDKVLHMEALDKENDGDGGVSEQGNTDLSGGSGGIEFDEDLLESITDKLHSDPSSIQSLTPEERRYLDRIARSVQGKSGSSMLKLWVPYWQPIADPLLQGSVLQKEKFSPVADGAAKHSAYGRVDVVRMHYLDTQLRELCQGLSGSGVHTGSSPGPASRDGHTALLGYQLIGGLLGYVTMMRTLSGGWAAREQVDSAVEEGGDTNKKSASKANKAATTTGDGAGDGNKTDLEKEQWQEEVRACLAHLHLDGSGTGTEESITGEMKSNSHINIPVENCLDLLLQSSPFISPSFRPLSVSEAVAAWVSSSPPSLTRRLKGLSSGCVESDGTSSASGSGGGVLRDAVKTLLIDVCHILYSPHIALYAMLDMWMMGYIADCEREEEGGKDMLEKSLASIACWPPEPSQPLADAVLPLAQHFKANVFGVRSKCKKRNVSAAELYTRKAFLLLTHFLECQHADTTACNVDRDGSGCYSSLEYSSQQEGGDGVNAPWNKSLLVELNWYISNYCSA
jgi:hypothetical protein